MNNADDPAVQRLLSFRRPTAWFDFAVGASEHSTPFPATKDPVNPPSQILVGFNEKVVCIRVRGKGSFQNSAGVKQFALAMIHRGHREFVVDLAECPVMDSTFMGTLTGVALKLRGLGSGNLHIVHPNERNASLLRGLGLDQILDLADDDHHHDVDSVGGDDRDAVLVGAMDPPSQPEEILAAATPAGSGSDRRQTTETMLAAHQALVDADPENLSRFKDVLDYLKQDLARADDHADGSGVHAD